MQPESFLKYTEKVSPGERIVITRAFILQNMHSNAGTVSSSGGIKLTLGGDGIHAHSSDPDNWYQIDAGDPADWVAAYGPNEEPLHVKGNYLLIRNGFNGNQGNANFGSNNGSSVNQMNIGTNDASAIECLDPDEDEIISTIDVDNDNDGILNSDEGDSIFLDTDGDGTNDVFDLDADDDDCFDALEGDGSYGTSDIDEFGELIGTPDSEGLIGTAQGYGESIDDFLYSACPDSDGDGILDIHDLDDDNDGILDSNEGDGLIDTDSDGTPDSLDVDADNDGCFDMRMMPTLILRASPVTSTVMVCG